MSDAIYRATTTGVSLTDALKALSRTPAIGLFIAPGWCQFGRVDCDAQATFADPKFRLAEVYEARVFNDAAELRWWNDPAEARHRAAVLTEEPNSPVGWQLRDPITIAGTIAQTYLLWGRRSDAPAHLPSGWTRLTTARIGSLDVPAAGEGRFEICAREYLKVFEDGNVAVAEERLLAVRAHVREEANRWVT